MTAGNSSDPDPPKISNYPHSKYKPEIVDEILDQLATGEALHTILKNNPEFPGVGAFYRWLNKYDDLVERYAHANEQGLRRMENEVAEIADDPDIPSDHKRIMVDTRKWLLSKRIPKKYGDRVEHEHVGAAIQVNVLNKIGDASGEQTVAIETSGEPKKLEDKQRVTEND